MGAALDRLYAAFSGLDRPVRLDRCADCFSAADEAEILADVPVRSLPDRIVDRFAFNLVCEKVGESQDLRYFLPRVLEVALLDGEAITDLPAVGSGLSKLVRGGWDEHEQGAVRGFLLDVWELILNGAFECDFAEEVLVALGVMGGLPTALNSLLARLDEPVPAERFSWLVDEGFLFRNGRWEPWSGDWIAGGDIVNAWLTSSELQRRVTAILPRTRDDRVDAALSGAARILGYD